MYLWVWHLFFPAVRETLGSRNRHSRSRAKLVRSFQVDRESWQRLITMNNEWLTGSLYKELFRFRHTLTIFSLSECELQSRQSDLYQLVLLQLLLYSCWIFPETVSVPCSTGIKSQAKMKATWMRQIVTSPTLPLHSSQAGQSDFYHGWLTCVR